MADYISTRPHMTILLRLSNQPFPLWGQLCIVTGNEPYLVINPHAANGASVTQIFQRPDEIRTFLGNCRG